MANPTSNFNWQMPTPTDLVTDLPADFEVFGQAVDSSMADLLGGTSGQVLAKNSNTDMDFIWVAQDDSNAIQNAIVDAKGDLIGATANDTPARLAVGTDYGFLQAISGETTGLLWNNAAWTTYTPTVTAVSGSYTTVSATGRYTRIGKLCAVQARVSITTNGTAAVATIITAPFTSASSSQTYNGSGRENLSTGLMLNCRIGSNDSVIYIEQYNAVYAGANNRQLDVSIIFEVA
jgi:hypothetical protein